MAEEEPAIPFPHGLWQGQTASFIPAPFCISTEWPSFAEHTAMVLVETAEFDKAEISAGFQGLILHGHRHTKPHDPAH